MFKSVGTDYYNSKILREKLPILLARICRDYDYRAQLRILEGVSKRYIERLKVCLLDENSIETFNKCGIDGSPAFVIFHGGEEKGRLLGKADWDSLDSFISKILSSIPDEKEMTRVLVVDEGQKIRSLFQYLQSEAGYEVSLAGHETDVREILSSSEFDVAVVDGIRARRESGRKLIENIKALQPSCEVLVMPNFSSRHEGSKSPKEEGLPHITKPMKKDEIIRAVEKAAGKSKAQKESFRGISTVCAQPLVVK